MRRSYQITVLRILGDFGNSRGFVGFRTLQILIINLAFSALLKLLFHDFLLPSELYKFDVSEIAVCSVY